MICRHLTPAEHHLCGQPGSEDNSIPRQLANASQQIRDLAHTNHSDTSSWYENRDNAPHALLIHPDEFTTYVNLKLLPTLLLPNEPNMVTPVRVDPFRTIPWQREETREVLLNIRSDDTICTEYIWTMVQ